jgi:hypothetical protein
MVLHPRSSIQNSWPLECLDFDGFRVGNRAEGAVLYNSASIMLVTASLCQRSLTMVVMVPPLHTRVKASCLLVSLALNVNRQILPARVVPLDRHCGAAYETLGALSNQRLSSCCWCLPAQVVVVPVAACGVSVDALH